MPHFPIRRMIAAALLVGSLSPAIAQAEPGGCLKYGAVGAVGGHLAHHGVIGAAGGCAAGMWKRHQYRKSVRQKAQMYDQERQGAPVDGSRP